MAFKAGDIVQLKSGGPDMTINFQTLDGDYQCTWWGSGKFESMVFSAAALTKGIV